MRRGKRGEKRGGREGEGERGRWRGGWRGRCGLIGTFVLYFVCLCVCVGGGRYFPPSPSRPSSFPHPNLPTKPKSPSVNPQRTHARSRTSFLPMPSTSFPICLLNPLYGLLSSPLLSPLTPLPHPSFPLSPHPKPQSSHSSPIQATAHYSIIHPSIHSLTHSFIHCSLSRLQTAKEMRQVHRKEASEGHWASEGMLDGDSKGRGKGEGKR